MKKNLKRISALCLAGLLGSSVTMLAGCGGGGGENGDNKNKTALNIKVFNGGLGTEWIKELEASFESKFENVSFEDGKTGVDISITANKAFDDLHSNMASGADAEDIYYTATSDLWDFMSLGVAYDITDIMTAKVYDASGNVTLGADGKSWATQQRSLADKINVDYYKDAFNLGTEEEPSYYSIPYEDSLSGIVVDWDLFVEEGWNNGSGIDGMPGTFQEFKSLLLKIQEAGYSAFTYSPAVGYYTPSIQKAVRAKVDGVDMYNDMTTDFTYDYDFNGDGTISDDEKVTPTNMEKTIDTKGMKSAVEMAYEMFKKDADSSKTFYDADVIQGVSFGGAQQNFVMSKTLSYRDRIAMIIEGEWWENETRATFNSMGRQNADDGYGKREFRFMPIPKMTNNDKTEKYTIGSFSNGCVTIVNQKTVANNPVKEKLAELWLQYQYSDMGLKTFTKHSGAVLPFDYQLTDAEFEELTPFAQNVWELHHSDQVEIVYDGPMMKSETIRFGKQTFGYTTKIDGTEYAECMFNNFVKFRHANKDYSVAEYLKGMHTYYDGKFAAAYGQN